MKWLLVLALLVACGRQEPRFYIQNLGSKSITVQNWHWHLPAGWEQKPGNEIRLATLVHIGSGVEVSVIHLSGKAGSLAENLQRWLGQMSVELTATQLDSIAAALPVVNGFYVANFSAYAKDDVSAIWAAMLPIESGAYFLKTTAPQPTIAQLESDLEAIVQSFHTNVH